MKYLRNVIKNLPTLITALVFAMAVWIFSVNQSDPTETRAYPQPINLEIIGQDSNLIIVNDIREQISLTLRAPKSILDQLENDRNLINVTLDLSGYEAGLHTLTPQVNIALSPVEVVRFDPVTIVVKLDTLVSESFPIAIKTLGNPAIGFEIQTPELSQEAVMISVPQSVVDSIEEVVAEVSIVDVSEDIQRNVDVSAFNAEGNILEGLLSAQIALR